MNRLSLFLVALVLGLSTWVAPRAARACSCVPPPPPAVAMERASAVFVGTVRSTTKKGELRRAFTLDVERAFKGVDGSEVTIVTPGTSAACGRSFEVGKRYLVYADDVEGHLSDNLCSRTALVDDAKHDLEALDAVLRGQTPPPEPRPAVEDKEDEQRPPPSGAAEPAERPAHEEGPATRPAPTTGPTGSEPPGDAPAGHCAATGGTSLPLALVGLALLSGARLRRRARRRMSV